MESYYGRPVLSPQIATIGDRRTSREDIVMTISCSAHLDIATKDTKA